VSASRSAALGRRRALAGHRAPADALLFGVFGPDGGLLGGVDRAIWIATGAPRSVAT
jgi:hypothetical protein